MFDFAEVYKQGAKIKFYGVNVNDARRIIMFTPDVIVQNGFCGRVGKLVLGLNRQFMLFVI